MKRLIAIILTVSMVLCSFASCGAETTDIEFRNLSDPPLLQYIEDSIYSDLEYTFQSDDYIIEDISAIYISQEYLDEVTYNSEANIYFGYTLAELDAQFLGTRYVFALSDDGQTTVKAFEEYDDTYDKALKNVAVGTGVILVCVTVSVITAGTAAPAAVSVVFAAAAKTGTAAALSAGVLSGVTTGVVTGMQTNDFDKAIKAAALSGSESFKWGAITGAIAGGAGKAISIHNAGSYTGGIPKARTSEIYARELYGGSEQLTYLGGKEVAFGTPGATRPDVVRMVNGHIEAIEVKNYDLARNSRQLYTELYRQVSERATNLPGNATQRVVLDVRGRGYTSAFLNDISESIQSVCSGAYQNLPISFLRY